MNKLLSSLSFAVLLASAGCQKSVDLDRLQKETLVDVNAYASEIEILQKRAESLLARGREIASAPGVNEAGKRLTEARARLEQLRGTTQSAQTNVAAAAKTGYEAVKKASDELFANLLSDIALVRADLVAVESWIANAEKAAAEAAQAPAQAPAGTPDEAPPTDEAPEATPADATAPN